MRIGPILLALTSVVCACGGDDGDDTGAGTTTGTASGGTVAPTGDSTVDPTIPGTSTTAPDPVTSDASSEASGDPTTSGSGTETGPGDTTGAPLAPCAPATDDTACDTCVKESCCAQLTACDADPECVCFQECAGSMPPSLQVPMICGEQCEIATPFAHPTVGQVLSCSAGCIVACGV